MILKIIGAVLLVSACFFVGLSKSRALYRRRDFFKSFIVFLSTLETNLRYNCSDIFILVSLCAKSCELSYFIIDQSSDKPFVSVWNKIVSSLPSCLSLKNSDIELLLEFGSHLGKSDLDGQLKHVELYKEIFSNQLSLADEDINKKSKLYKTMGLFVGISTALLII